MENNGNKKVLFELEPLLLSDETEVKIPVTVNSTTMSRSETISLQCGQSNIVSPITESQYSRTACTEPSYDMNYDMNYKNDLVELNRLQGLIRELPSGMFVNRVLVDYNQSEPDLEQLRQRLFNILKESEDFPFDTNSELKRRVHTRNGETACAKLANDIYSLLSVIDGGDFSDVKDIISTSKKGRNNSTTKYPAIVAKQDNCQCKAEIGLLKATIEALQADVLLMKQRQAASQNLMSGDMKSITESLSELKKDVESKYTDMKKSLDTMKTSCKEATDALTTRVMSCKRDVNENNKNVIKIQEQMISTSFALEHMRSSMGYRKESEENTKHNCAELIPNTCITDSVETESNNKYGGIPIPAIVTQRTQRHRNTRVSFAEINREKDMTSHDKEQMTKSSYSAAVNNGKSARSFHSKMHKDSRQLSQPANHSYPMHDDLENKRDCGLNYDEFYEHIRRRTKRYYVGGFKPSISEDTIARYVQSKGLTVTKVSIFRNDKRKTTVVRVNVEDDGTADNLTEDYTFWPRGIICRPWLSRNARQNIHDTDTIHNDHQRGKQQPPKHGQQKHFWSRHNVTIDRDHDHSTNNRFSVLCDDVE